MSKIERLMRIYNRLRKGPVTIEIISSWAKQADIQISERQLYRDLNTLQFLNFTKGENVIEFIDEKNRKTWKLEYSESKTNISTYDINTFFLYKHFVPECILVQRKSSFEKFEYLQYKQLSKNKFEKLIQANEQYIRNTRFGSYNYSPIEHEKIEQLIWALQNKRVIIIESIDIEITNIKERSLEYPLNFYPLELLFHGARIVIAGLEVNSKKLFFYSIESSLMFSLANIQFDRKKLEKIYYKQLNDRFGISEPISNRVYNIKVEHTESFGKSHQNFYFHHTQKWYKLKNGNLMFEVTCFITREMIGWLSYGLDKVKVHKPKILRDLIVKKYNDTLSMYNSNTAPNETIANADY
ncbi:MAG: hypothetical protein ACOVO1_05315 [Chitinophagaceae bacterium]